MSSGGKFASSTAIPIPQPPPQGRDSSEVQAAIEAERRMRAARKGRGSTLLAGTSDVQMGSGGKTLLGT